MLSRIFELIWNKKYIFLFITLFILVLTQRFTNERQNGLVVSVSSDGLGYYAYLPAAVIYQDFSYSYYSKPENKIKPFYNPSFSHYKENKLLNKYYCGTAFCLLPFFILGIIISTIAGTTINGYTDTFLMLVSIAPIVYYLISIALTIKIAKFFSISDKIAIATSLIIFFGTNLFHYVIQEPSMSHAYSFFAVTLFLYLFTQLIQNTTNLNLIYLGLSLGLIALIRPPNVIVVLFTPFFFSNINSFFVFVSGLFKKNYFGLLTMIIVLVSCVFIQLLFYYFQTGDFYIVSYEGESFNFKNPEFFNTLWSYRKGLFLYTPILLAFLVFIFLVKKEWYKKTVFIITISLFTYITASWWCWWYGGGFGNRPFIDIYPLLIVACLFFYNKISVTFRKIALIISLPFIFVNQIMAYQYSNLIMDTGNMDKQRYWDIFLETDMATINSKRIKKIVSENLVLKTEILDFETLTNDNTIVNEGFNSNKSCIVGKNNFYSKAFSIPVSDLNIISSFFVIAECDVKTDVDGKNLNLAVSLFEENECTKWDVVFRNQFNQSENGWTRMSHVVFIRANEISHNSVIKVFALDDKANRALVDNLKYTIVKTRK